MPDTTPLLWTYVQAGAVLGCAARTVRSLVQQGKLTKCRQGPRVYVLASEVEALHQVRQSGGAWDTARLNHLLFKVERLERTVATLQALLDTKNRPLDLSPDDAQQLIQLVLAARAQKTWSAADRARWAPLFLQLQETDLAQLQALGLAQPGQAFLELCVRMQLDVRSDPHFATSLALQEEERVLAEGRSRLRQSMLLLADQQKVYGALTQRL